MSRQDALAALQAIRGEARNVREAAIDMEQLSTALSRAATDVLEQAGKAEKALPEDEPDPGDGPEAIDGHLWTIEERKAGDADILPPAPSLRTLVAVFTWTPEPGDYEKIAGADSTANDRAAWALGVHRSGQLEAWAQGGPDQREARLDFPTGKPVLAVVRFEPQRVLLWCAGRSTDAEYQEELDPFDGAIAVMAGFWNHEVVDHANAQLHEMHAYERVLEDAELDGLIDWYEPVTGPNGGEVDEPPLPPKPDPKPKPPPGRPPATEGEVKVHASMGSQAVEKAINDAPRGYRVTLAPETYDRLSVRPKDGQVWVCDDGEAVLHGRGRNKRAISGDAIGCWLEGLVVTNYQCGLGTEWRHIGGRDARAQIAAVEPEGDGGRGRARDWTLRRVRITENFCRGISWCNGMTLLGYELTDNGHCGGAGRARDLTLDGGLVRGNNRFHMSTHWESGGLKIAGGAFNNGFRPPASNIRILRTIITDNYGPGFWADWNMFAIEIAWCSIFGNHWSGITLEASAVAHVHHNQIGENERTGFKDAIFKLEVMCQNAKKVTLEKNLIVVTRGGTILMGQQNRSDGSPQGDAHIGHFSNTECWIRDNTWLLMADLGPMELHDRHGCAQNDVSAHGQACAHHYYNFAPQPGGLDPNDTNAFAFIPQKGHNRHNAAHRNTYRTASGSPRLLSFETDARNRGNPAAYVPDWWTLPTWETPPGLED